MKKTMSGRTRGILFILVGVLMAALLLVPAWILNPYFTDALLPGFMLLYVAGAFLTFLIVLPVYRRLFTDVLFRDLDAYGYVRLLNESRFIHHGWGALANAARQSGDYDTAVSIVQSILSGTRKVNRRASLLAFLGAVALRRRDDESLRTVTEQLRREVFVLRREKDVKEYGTLVNVYEHVLSGDFAGALKLYETLPQDKNRMTARLSDVNTRSVRAILLWRMGETEQALTLFASVAADAPNLIAGVEARQYLDGEIPPEKTPDPDPAPAPAAATVDDDAPAPAEAASYTFDAPVTTAAPAAASPVAALWAREGRWKRHKRGLLWTTLIAALVLFAVSAIIPAVSDLRTRHEINTAVEAYYDAAPTDGMLLFTYWTEAEDEELECNVLAKTSDGRYQILSVWYDENDEIYAVLCVDDLTVGRDFTYFSEYDGRPVTVRAEYSDGKKTPDPIPGTQTRPIVLDDHAAILYITAGEGQ